MIFTAPVLAVYKLCELNFLNIIVILIGEILLCCFIKFQKFFLCGLCIEFSCKKNVNKLVIVVNNNRIK